MQIFCGLIHSTTVISSFSYYIINYSLYHSISSDISQLLGAIGYFGSTLAAFTFIKVVWINQKEILDFLRMLQQVVPQQKHQNLQLSKEHTGRILILQNQKFPSSYKINWSIYLV